MVPLNSAIYLGHHLSSRLLQGDSSVISHQPPWIDFDSGYPIDSQILLGLDESLAGRAGQESQGGWNIEIKVNLAHLPI